MSKDRNKVVHIFVDKHYFDNFFEPARKKLESDTGFRFTQKKFTAYLARSGAKIVYPKMPKLNPIPKQLRRRFL